MNGPNTSTTPPATPFHMRVLYRLQPIYWRVVRRLESVYFGTIRWAIYLTAELSIIFVLLTVGYAAFSVLGYALLSISTIPTGHVLSVFYASLIGGIILVPTVVITSGYTYGYVYDYHLAAYYPEHIVATYWMKYVPRVFITPVFIGGNALGMTILERSSFDGSRVEMGHLVATSALGGLVCEVIYECIRQMVLLCGHLSTYRSPF